jgi:hypothetical protein
MSSRMFSRMAGLHAHWQISMLSASSMEDTKQEQWLETRLCMSPRMFSRMAGLHAHLQISVTSVMIEVGRHRSGTSRSVSVALRELCEDLKVCNCEIELFTPCICTPRTIIANDLTSNTCSTGFVTSCNKSSATGV